MGPYLAKASSHGKAVFLVHELQQGMVAADLRGLFLELAASDAERRALADALEEVLRQHRYAPADIWQLMATVYPERTAAGVATPHASGGAPIGAPAAPRPPAAAARRPGKRTQPVKSPFLKPFEADFGTRSPQPPPEIPHPAEQPPPKLPTPTTKPAGKQPGTLRDVDKTAFFGASLKGLHLQAVRPKTKARVLVADDDQRIRLIYRTKLEENGYMVIEAGNGMEAWRLISTGEADVVVLDMKMPGYHGLDVLSRMSDAGMDIPVIISTAYDQLSDEFVVATYPRLKYLVKPVDPNDLLAAVAEFVQ